MPMTGNIDRVEIITSVQRRRRWPAEEKAAIVQETYAPEMSASLVARQHGIAPTDRPPLGSLIAGVKAHRAAVIVSPGSEFSPGSADWAPHVGVGWWIGRSGPTLATA